MNDVPHRIRGFDHTVTLPKGSVFIKKRWCRDQFGAEWSAIANRDGIWVVFWAAWPQGDYNWHFKNEKDATWFALRWA